MWFVAGSYDLKRVFIGRICGLGKGSYCVWRLSLLCVTTANKRLGAIQKVAKMDDLEYDVIDEPAL